MKKCILVDVDGTLADNSHRQHFVQTKPKNWPAYDALMHLDGAHEVVCWLVKELALAGHHIVIVTARQEHQRDITVKTLDEVCGLKGLYVGPYMRQSKDSRPDSIIKMELLEQIRADGHDPYMVLDDRDQVVKAWREAGLVCLQVRPGAF